MAVSGNSIAAKSYMSFTVSDGLLAKVIEAVKAGEKDARTSGDIKSFEIFSHGFRQQVSIGRVFIIPVKVANNFKDFPIALLYGTVVRELNLGEEVADLIEKKIGESEFDEYSQLDIQKLKDTLFYDVESEEYRSLILFAPNWTNIREYVVFKFTADDEKLSNLLRHLIFSAYFNPSVSGAFDALMTTVDTNKLDICDITPKLTYPFITENPLKAYPELVKQGGWAKPKVFLTAKTADAITKEVLDPQELNVFEALDSALTEATFPETDSMDEVADFKGPTGHNEGNADIPQVEGIENTKSDEQFRDFIQKGKEAGTYDPKTMHSDGACRNCNGQGKFRATELNSSVPQTCTVCHGTGGTVPSANKAAAEDDGTELRRRPDYGEKGSYTQQMNVENEKTAALFDYNATECADCHEPLDALKLCPNADAKNGQQFCGKGLEVPNVSLGAPQKGIQREPVSQPGRQYGAAKTAEIDMGQVPSQQDRRYQNYTRDKKPVNTVVYSNSDGVVRGYFMPEGHHGKREFKFEVPMDKATYQRIIKPFVVRQDSNGAFEAFKKLPGVKIASAPFETPFTNVGPGTSAHDNAEKAIAVKVDTLSTKGEPPIGIELDKTGLPVHDAADKIASEILRDLDTGYVAMSSKAKAAAQKREDELNKKYAGRDKSAKVPLTEESIWSDLMKDFGEAPQVKLPGEGSSDSKSTESLPETMTSETPEKDKEVSEADINKAEPKPETKSDSGPKSKLFQNKNKPEEPKKESAEPVKEEPKAEEPKKEEPKEASAKTALTFMNDYDIELAKQKLGNDPILGPAVRFLEAFKEEVDSHSDGWAYWRPPVQAAAQLMALIKAGENNLRVQHGEGRESDKASVTVQDLTKAMAPIKAFMTRRGLAAGMQMPKLAVRVKKADHSALPDYVEAKSEVVSPDTVDKDIKQPTESVSEAAKVATPGVKTVRVVGGDGHKHKCPECNETLTCNNPKDCPGVGKEALCGSCPGTGKKAAWDESGAGVGKPAAKPCSNFEGHTKPNGICWNCRRDYSEHIEGKKKAADVSGDISEAKSEVVSPDTVDADIKQPTESVSEAAKVAADGSAADFSVQDEGSIAILYALTADAQQWVAENLPEDVTLWGQNGVVIEPRYLGDIIEGIKSEGLTFEDDGAHTAAAGDDNDEAVEMGLGDGDLADLAANLPSPVSGIVTASAKTAGNYYELTPAYGRDYKSGKEAKEAWLAGKDFEGDFQLGFKPVNINDIPRPCTVLLRFKRNTGVVSVGVK